MNTIHWMRLLDEQSNDLYKKNTWKQNSRNGLNLTFNFLRQLILINNLNYLFWLLRLLRWHFILFFLAASHLFLLLCDFHIASCSLPTTILSRQWVSFASNAIRCRSVYIMLLPYLCCRFGIVRICWWSTVHGYCDNIVELIVIIIIMRRRELLSLETNFGTTSPFRWKRAKNDGPYSYRNVKVKQRQRNDSSGSERKVTEEAGQNKERERERKWLSLQALVKKGSQNHTPKCPMEYSEHSFGC